MQGDAEGCRGVLAQHSPAGGCSGNVVGVQGDAVGPSHSRKASSLWREKAKRSWTSFFLVAHRHDVKS